MDDSSQHVFWLAPLPGVGEYGRIITAAGPFTLLILLPDDSHIVISADRAVYIQAGRSMVLSQWQMGPEDQQAAELLRTGPALDLGGQGTLPPEPAQPPPAWGDGQPLWERDQPRNRIYPGRPPA